MAAELVNRANSLFVDGEYEQAVELYTEALEKDPGNAHTYTSRAEAHLRLEDFMEASEDAGKALDLDPSLSLAHLRKGIACFNLDEYETAKACFESGLALNPAKKQKFETWMRKCDAEMEDEKANAQQSEPTPPAVAVPQPPPSPSTAPVTVEERTAEKATEVSKPLAPAAQATKEGKYRHQWYQAGPNIMVQIFAKRLTTERVTVNFQEDRLTIVTRDEQGEQDYEFDIPLYAKVEVEQCKYEILSTKIELKLKKKEINRSWATLSSAQEEREESDEKAAGEYPSSHQKKTDWGRLDKEMKKEEEDEKLDGDAAVQKLFRQIYASSDEETRRAMNKSFVESNGTVLSTNWKEVGKGKVECTPPSGLDVKKYCEP